MTTLTWDSLPKLRDGHPSDTYRRGTPAGMDEYGALDYEWVPVPCGEWFDGGTVLCDNHESLYRQEYPQGWRYYPGDVCVHGAYTGGCGVDWICGPCEQGETFWVESPAYTLFMHIGEPHVPTTGVEIASWSDIRPFDLDRVVDAAQGWQDVRDRVPDGTIQPFHWVVVQTRSGYWDNPENHKGVEGGN